MTNRVPSSNYFRYTDGVLHAEGTSLAEIARDIGTPSYVYSGAAIDDAYRQINDSLEGSTHIVAYAVKANGNLAILARLARAGCGADIVSGGELARALKAGFASATIVFSGVGKTADEIRNALLRRVRAIHIESEAELDLIEQIAGELKLTAPVSLRVNPNVDAKTHPYIATGLKSSKFGIHLATARRMVPRIVQSPHLNLEGVACHIGSMILSPEPIRQAVEITARFATECVAAGADLRTLDAGGGWPIRYGDEDQDAGTYAQFGKAVLDGIRRADADKLNLCVLVEPGRAIVGDAGVLLTRVLHVKDQGEKRFVVVDAAITELLRPALYGAYHAIVPVNEPRNEATMTVDVVGPVCESGDFLAQDREMPRVRAGDILAIRGAGGYASVMASTYNARPHAAEVLVDGTKHRVVRTRQRIEDMWRDETV